jgi:carboxymethylenebutenolidase
LRALAGTFQRMCFDLDSRPPIPALAGAAVAHEDLVLRSADGTSFAAFAARPEHQGPTGVVVLPDVRGLYRFYEEVALRLAEHGHSAVAIDWFGRTAGVGKRGEEFEHMEHVARTTPETIREDVAAAIEHLCSPAGGSCSAIFTLGFCFGGRASWLAAADGHGLAGAIGFYGNPGERNGRPGPTQRAAEISAPILGLMGGADPNITAPIVGAFDEALSAAGVEHEIVSYEGAPHSFFDRKQEEFAEASADAWQRTLRFIEAHASRGDVSA